MLYQEYFLIKNLSIEKKCQARPVPSLRPSLRLVGCVRTAPRFALAESPSPWAPLLSSQLPLVADRPQAPSPEEALTPPVPAAAFHPQWFILATGSVTPTGATATCSTGGTPAERPPPPPHVCSRKKVSQGLFPGR